MNPDFIYLRHYDLVFHALAHMQVDNISDLYCEEYIEQVDRPLLAEIMATLAEYYNANFERLSLVNFLPCYVADYDAIKDLFQNYQSFTPEDIEHFIAPFLAILDEESADYFPKWDEIHAGFDEIRPKAIAFFEDRMEKYSCIFEYHKKTPRVLFSYALTKNGRGMGGKTSFLSAVPFPKTQQEFPRSFFQMLHEYTHNFTDELIKTPIKMDDGSHTESETLAILADYLFVKTIEPIAIGQYFEFLQKNGIMVWESNLFRIIKIEQEMATKLKALADGILALRKIDEIDETDE